MSPAQLLAAAQFIADRWPDAAIARNPNGNLAWSVPGGQFAWMDLETGTVHHRDGEGQWVATEPGL